ncbi:hypothetical protein PR202_ga03575 [Eleusine coracana subsp. coracana]|uniref:KIB1-4 beta-propeller domain-containing protein n=1 Tax=Eleusine coracana subsp. coracana TaxID=191504 RepID=A0AAV5BPF3_ELECO|nr:hypothetical protein PR202_ga03575 [Eleusine coracana subsp. coracana]
MVIDSSNTFTFGEFREWFYYKAFVFSNASTGGYIVVLIHKPLNQISVARKGDDKWTWLPPDNCYSNCVYKDDLLYAVSGGEIRVFDLSGPIPAAKIIMKSKIEWWNGSSYITEAPHGGDLLHTHRSTGDINYDAEADPKASVWHTEKIEVYKIDVAEETVAEINCLNDHVLFLGHNQSLCLHANEYPPLKANHAYFTDDTKFSERYKNNCCNIGVLNEGNSDREDLVSPQHWSSWPTPIWITPNLVQL